MLSSSRSGEYSGGPVLALDTGSPQVSVAIAIDGQVVASRSLPQASSSRALLPAVDQVLKRSGLKLRDVDGLLALAGPGSFTGLRVGLATILGLHQATGIAAGTLPTLEVLAGASRAEGIVVAAIDARREEWVLRPFSAHPREPLAASQRCSSAQVPELTKEFATQASEASATVLGFGVSGLPGQDADWNGISAQEPPPLAAIAAMAPFGRSLPWDAAALTRPLYFRPPSVTRPKR